MYEQSRSRGRLLVFPLALCLLAGIACGGANVASTPKVLNACGYLKVGARLAEGEGGGGSCPRLGANLFKLPLSQSVLTILGKDPSGNELPPDVGVTDHGTIVLTASPSGAGVAVPGSKPQQALTDVVAIADFTPESSTGGRFGILLRCTFTACITVTVNPRGTYEIGDYDGHAKPVGTPLRGAADVPALRASRLVVMIKGPSVEAWLNGNRLPDFRTNIADGGVTAFVDVADGVELAQVRVSGLSGFQPA